MCAAFELGVEGFDLVVGNLYPFADTVASGAGFDDSAWDYALDIGPIGDTSNPWGNAPSIFPSGSPAHWIWDGVHPLPQGHELIARNWLHQVSA